MESHKRSETKCCSKSNEKPKTKALHLMFCKLCPKLFSRKENLTNHFKVNHPGHRLNFRSRSFKYSTSLKNQGKISCLGNNYICDICGGSVSSKKGFKTHVTRVHLRIRPYMCPYCTKTYGDNTSLKDHINVHHRIKKDTFECDKCDKVFISKACWREHNRRHGSQKIHHCQFCRMSFHKLYEKTKHLKTHRPLMKTLKCYLCDKLFASPEGRQNHIKTVHESVSTTTCCVFCEKFIVSSMLFDHLRRHIKEYSHQCELCGKPFCTAVEKSQHLRTHTGEKPFKCTDCGLCFAIKNNLLRHERTHLTPKLLPLPCVFCGEEFPTHIQLWRHIARKTGERPYICQLCPKDFRIKGELNCHLRYTHQRGEYKCDKCEKVYELISALKQHKHRHHR